MLLISDEEIPLIAQLPEGPSDESWDSIFLCPIPQWDFGLLLAWYARNMLGLTWDERQ